MTKEIICTVCPMGCHIQVSGEGGQVDTISGYSCKRGGGICAAGIFLSGTHFNQYSKADGYLTASSRGSLRKTGSGRISVDSVSTSCPRIQSISADKK